MVDSFGLDSHWVCAPICVGLHAYLSLLSAFLSCFFLGMHRIAVPLAWPQQEINPGVPRGPNEEPSSLWPGRGVLELVLPFFRLSFPLLAFPSPCYYESLCGMGVWAGSWGTNDGVQSGRANSLFSMVYFYTLRCYAKVTWGQQS